MIRKCVEIVRRNTLYPHHAAAFARAAGRFVCEVTAISGEYRVDGKSILGLISLEPQIGMIIILEADGEDEQVAVEILAKILEGYY